MDIITKIEVQKKYKDRYNIYINNSFFLGISEDTLINLNLYKDKEVSKKDLSKLIYEEEKNKAYSYTLNYLGYRMRSIYEVRTKLKEKQYDDDIIDDVIFKLEELNYLNDELFANSFIKTRLNSKKYGPKKIKYDLQLKGISKNIIDKSLNLLYNKDIEYEICTIVYNKNKHKYNKDQKQKLLNFLLNRGFNYNVVKDIIF